MKTLKLSAIMMILFLALIGCGSDDDDDDNDAVIVAPPEAGEDINLTANFDFQGDGDDGFDAEGSEFDITFTGSIELPSEIQVVEGNSGTGWAGIEVGDRKFCYQGNASDASTADGTAYVLMNEAANDEADCSDEGTASPDTNVDVTPDQDLELDVDSPGCEGDACVNTSLEAIVEITSSDA